jgi:4'-phosphopantetheinyl transferase
VGPAMSQVPGSGCVHVWRVQLDQPATVVDSLLRELDSGERERSAAFHREADRARFAVAHAALRQILAEYVRSQPSHLRFARGSRGKPSLDRTGPHFSFSRSEAIALVAVASDRPVGVDIERVRFDCDTQALAERFFSRPEAELLERASPEHRLVQFFRLWTCKESCVKESGEGIGGLRDAEIALDAAGAAHARPWSLAELLPARGYRGAVAARGGPIALEQHGWERPEAGTP